MSSSERILLDTGPSTHSWRRLEDFLHCPQLFAYKHLLKLDLGSREPLVRGSIGHAGLAHHYARLRAHQRGEDVERYYSPAEAMMRVADRLSADGKLLKLALAAVQSYAAAHTQELETLEILKVEEQVAATIRWPSHLLAANPARAEAALRITQRQDLVYRERATRKIFICDHKFVGHIEAKTLGRYIPSGQFLLMQWFGHAMYGDAFGGAVVNVVSIEDPPAMRRESIGPAPNLLGRLPQILCDGEEQIQRLAAEGRDPMEYPAAISETACWTPYGRCDGWDLCRFGS